MAYTPKKLSFDFAGLSNDVLLEEFTTPKYSVEVMWTLEKVISGEDQ